MLIRDARSNPTGNNVHVTCMFHAIIIDLHEQLSTYTLILLGLAAFTAFC